MRYISLNISGKRILCLKRKNLSSCPVIKVIILLKHAGLCWNIQNAHAKESSPMMLSKNILFHHCVRSPVPEVDNLVYHTSLLKASLVTACTAGQIPCISIISSTQHISQSTTKAFQIGQNAADTIQEYFQALLFPVQVKGHISQPIPSYRILSPPVIPTPPLPQHNHMKNSISRKHGAFPVARRNETWA